MINSKKKQFCKIYGFCTKSISKVTKKLLFFLQKISRTLKEYAIWQFFQRDGVLGTIKIALFANHGDIYCWHMIFFVKSYFAVIYSVILIHFFCFCLTLGFLKALQICFNQKCQIQMRFQNHWHRCATPDFQNTRNIVSGLMSQIPFEWSKHLD